MLGLFSYSDICQSLIQIADPNTLAQRGFSAHGLRMALQSRAHQLEPRLPIWDTSHTVLVASASLEHELRTMFCGRSTLNDLNQHAAVDESFSSAERTFKLNQLRRALDLLAQLDPHLFEILNVVVSCIFTSSSQTAGGGTSSATPGVIWANLRNHWSTWDTLEFLIHELTHNLMFFDEFHAMHYRNLLELSNPDTFAQSAILRKQRPLDKVIHSIMVGISILNLRANCVFQRACLKENLQPSAGVHPESQTLAMHIRESIRSVMANPKSMQLLSARGTELLERAHTRVNEFSEVCVSFAI